MIDVSHHRDYRGAWFHPGFIGRYINLLQERLGIIRRSNLGDMPHLLDDDHGSFLIEHLIDRHHTTHFHQYLDDLCCFDCHFLRQSSH